VTDDLERAFQFNTAIAALMEFYNTLARAAADHEQSGPEFMAARTEAVTTLVVLLAPFAPHIAEELWRRLGRDGFVAEQPWPRWDPRFTAADALNIVIQVNGKLRGQLTLPSDSSEEAVRQAALADPKVRPWLGDRPPKKVIVVPGKLVNIVV
jgi:leucyl-tRNA synthetase